MHGGVASRCSCFDLWINDNEKLNIDRISWIENRSKNRNNKKIVLGECEWISCLRVPDSNCDSVRMPLSRNVGWAWTNQMKLYARDLPKLDDKSVSNAHNSRMKGWSRVYRSQYTGIGSSFLFFCHHHHQHGGVFRWGLLSFSLL